MHVTKIYITCYVFLYGLGFHKEKIQFWRKIKRKRLLITIFSRDELNVVLVGLIGFGPRAIFLAKPITINRYQILAHVLVLHMGSISVFHDTCKLSRERTILPKYN